MPDTSSSTFAYSDDEFMLDNPAAYPNIITKAV